MLTKGILFGMDLTLAGFVVVELTLTLNRAGQIGKGLSIGLMAAGTALVLLIKVSACMGFVLSTSTATGKY